MDKFTTALEVVGLALLVVAASRLGLTAGLAAAGASLLLVGYLLGRKR